jgi:hypothetical protein
MLQKMFPVKPLHLPVIRVAAESGVLHQLNTLHTLKP